MSKRIKYLGINLSTEVKDMTTIKCWWKTLETTQIDGIIYHVPGLEEIIIAKMTKLPKATYRFTAIPLKTSMAFFTELKPIILKFLRKHKRPQVAKKSWEWRTWNLKNKQANTTENKQTDRYREQVSVYQKGRELSGTNYNIMHKTNEL